MRIAIITNIREQKGLWKDAVILKRLLESWAHEVHLFDFRDMKEQSRNLWFTVVFHLEVVAPYAFTWADKQIWIPNPDWTTPKSICYSEAFRAVLAKTLEGERVLKAVGVKRVIFTGFESEDRYIVGVPRERKFFHSWSENIMKGTRSVLRAWDLLNPKLPHEFILGSKIPDKEFQMAQNRCFFWIQPSAVEGYGHVIHEGLSCGALVATLDAPPMNESEGIFYRIPAKKVSRQNLADVWEARPEAIAAAARTMWAAERGAARSIEDAKQFSRTAYLGERAEFRDRLRSVLEDGL